MINIQVSKLISFGVTDPKIIVLVYDVTTLTDVKNSEFKNFEQKVIMGDLKVLQNLITETKEDLKTELDTKFLKVTKYRNAGLRYLPNFHLIFSALDNGNLCMRFITYHGRTLSTIFFKLNDAQVPNKITEALEDISVNAQVCKGLDRDKCTTEDCLVEYFNDSVIARSFKCAFLIKSDTEQCDECQRLIGVKKEVDLDHIDSVPALLRKKPKIEPENLLLIESLKDEEPEAEQTLEEFENEVDADWHPYDEDYEYEEQPKKKRGRPRKEPSLTIQRIPKKRGRPRLVYPPNEIPAVVKKVVKKENKIQNGGNKSFHCKICLKVYKSDSALTQHLQNHEKYLNISTSGTIQCPLCKTAIEKMDLTSHFEQIHSTKEQSLTCCIACLEVIPHKNGDQLRQHMSNHHQRHMCEICGKNFGYIKNLECHVKTKHFPESKDFFCDRCGKGFGHEIALHKHVQVACAMEEWKCELCTKIFGCRKKLRFHLMVHCEEKPYACRLCAYRYCIHS